MQMLLSDWLSYPTLSVCNEDSMSAMAGGYIGNDPGTDLGGGCRGAHPPSPEMKLSSSYLPSKFVYLTGQ